MLSARKLRISGALLGLILLGAPLFMSRAQEGVDVQSTSTNTDASPSSVVQSAEELGISVERIPNSGDVIGDFVVGPGKFEAFIEPGESLTTQISVTNRTGIDRRFNLEVEDIMGSADGSDSVILLGNDRGPYSIKDYLEFPTTSFMLEHGKRARIPVTITIPEDAEPGGFYGSVLTNTLSTPVEMEVEAGSAGMRSPVVKRIGTLFFITVPGENIYEGELKDFHIEPRKAWYEKGPFNFIITYENSGSSHLNPYGEISIENMFGEEVGFVELTPWFTLPQAVRLREVTWNRELLYGKYTATLKLNRGYDDIVDEKQITFWVIPWKFIALGFLVLFIVFFLFRSFFKNFEFRRKTD